MNRRTVLAAVGATAGSLAGCLAGGDDETGDESTTTPPDTPRGTPPANSGGLDEFDPAYTHEQVDVGSREGVDDRFGPHDVSVWNATDDERAFHVRIVDRRAEEAVYRDAHPTPADAALDLSLLNPSRYRLQVWGPDGEAQTTLRVDCSMFDCNGSVTRIAVHQDRTESSVMSTLAACPSPDC